MHDGIGRAYITVHRRAGEITLENMKNTMLNEEDIVQYFYKLRCDEEVID